MQAMQAPPANWTKYFHGGATSLWVERHFSYSIASAIIGPITVLGLRYHSDDLARWNAIAEVLRSIVALKVNPATGAPRAAQASVESPATQKSPGIAILRELGIPHVSDRIKVWELFKHGASALPRDGHFGALDQ